MLRRVRNGRGVDKIHEYAVVEGGECIKLKYEDHVFKNFLKPALLI